MTIQAEPRMKDANVGVVTHTGATTRKYGLQQKVRLTGKEKLAFDIVIEKDTLFDARNEI